MKESKLNPIIDTVEHVKQASGYSLVLEKSFIRSQPKTTILDGTNIEYIRFDNTSAQDVTGIKGGQDGQTVTVLGDGNTTIKHNVAVAKPAEKIMTNSAADKLLAANKVYRFSRYADSPTSKDGKWIEIA